MAAVQAEEVELAADAALPVAEAGSALPVAQGSAVVDVPTRRREEDRPPRFPWFRVRWWRRSWAPYDRRGAHDDVRRSYSPQSLSQPQS